MPFTRRQYLLASGLGLLGTPYLRPGISGKQLLAQPIEASLLLPAHTQLQADTLVQLVGALPLPHLQASGVLSKEAPDQNWVLGNRVIPPDLQLFDSTEFTAKRVAGKLLLIEFWASWCPYCALQNPRIEALYRKYKNRGLSILGISIDKDANTAIDYLKKHGYSFPNGQINPAWEAVFSAHKKVPLVYVLNSRGKIIRVESGEMLEDDINEIGSLLERPSAFWETSDKPL